MNKKTLSKKSFSILLGILVICFLISFVSCTSTFSSREYAESENYNVGNFTYSKENIESVSVFWNIGKVNVIQTGDDILSVKENAQNLSDAQKLHWIIKDNELKIEFCESKYTGSFDSEQKQLTLYIPFNVKLNIISTNAKISAESLNVTVATITSTSGDVGLSEIYCDDLSVVSTSGNISVRSANTTNAVSLTSVSGDISVSDSKVRGVSASLTSGDLLLENSTVVTDVTVNTVSGKTTVKDSSGVSLSVTSTGGNIETNCSLFEKITVNSVSGIVKIIDNKFDASVDFSTVSGHLRTSLKYNEEDGKYIFNSGKTEIIVSTTSGDLKIIQD